MPLVGALHWGECVSLVHSEEVVGKEKGAASRLDTELLFNEFSLSVKSLLGFCLLLLADHAVDD